MYSSKLSTATHILTFLASCPDHCFTSERIALSVQTNAVVVRRLLGRLRISGYVYSRSGPGGGWLLRVNVGEITLLDVLKAVEPRQAAIGMHRNKPNRGCAVSVKIRPVLTAIYADVQNEMNGRLAATTIKDVLQLLALP